MVVRCTKYSLLPFHSRFVLRCWQRSVAGNSKTLEFTSVKPKISTSFVKNIFLGNGVLSHVVPYPLNLSDSERETVNMILESTRKFMLEVNNPAENDENEGIPMENLSKFAEIGAFGLLVPEKYKGAGLSNSQMARLSEVVGGLDLSLAVVMGAHQSIGYKGILLFGTDEQKRKYLPDLATGRKFAAFCLTEPGTGLLSSIDYMEFLQSLQMQAVKSTDGKHYILNGSKLWISNGFFADVFTVFAKTSVKNNDGTFQNKVSAFIVERKYGGITIGSPDKKMGLRGSKTSEVHFDNTEVPVQNLLGAEGEGFKIAMKILNNGRVGLLAACIGSMKFCIEKTIQHVSDRVQFGKKLKEFGNVQEQLVDMVLRHYASESLLYMLSSAIDENVEDYYLEAAVGKILASENAWVVCDRAIQLHGGMGYMKECGLERIMRDLRIFRIFEGANDVLRIFIALTGLQYAGKHLQYKMKNFGSIIESLFSRNKFDFPCHSSLNDSVATLKKTVQKFGSISRLLLWKHKQGIIERQWEMTRLADATIDIYSVAAVLSRCTRAANQESFDYERKLAQLYTLKACQHAEAQMSNIVTQTADVDQIKSISDDIFQIRSLPSLHPLDY
ncbi:unnamed protein product [Thelazia callipaeda]|uniref:Very long-chain specific acyl-CoA dehydrogenase, mitochondrial n=1 Tax=Thelazia callipaeda TaxID=103827 RepID=A0A0N5D2S0_THECL|nr:unnamed protein product [Thelazia callipaeda]